MRRALPYAFTEQGVAMLSSVLRSERAVQANVTIMRVLTRNPGPSASATFPFSSYPSYPSHPSHTLRLLTGPRVDW